VKPSPRLQRIPDSLISDFIEHDPGCAITFTIFRDRTSYAPLLDTEVPTG